MLFIDPFPAINYSSLHASCHSEQPAEGEQQPAQPPSTFHDGLALITTFIPEPQPVCLEGQFHLTLPPHRAISATLTTRREVGRGEEGGRRKGEVVIILDAVLVHFKLQCYLCKYKDETEGKINTGYGLFFFACVFFKYVIYLLMYLFTHLFSDVFFYLRIYSLIY